LPGRDRLVLGADNEREADVEFADCNGGGDGGGLIQGLEISVLIDFERQTLADGLRDAGYDPGLSAFFSWLGVTPYLTIKGVMRTLRFSASAPKGSGVVFDYTVFPSLLTPDQRSIFDALVKRGDWVREPWQTFFDPAELVENLLAMGFGHVEDIGPAQINARYFDDRTDGLRVGSLAHIMDVRV
jgi:O-methyltransferase involved in polyketide biosynthesis